MENLESKVRRINQAVSDLKQTGVMSEGEARKALFALNEAGYDFVKKDSQMSDYHGHATLDDGTHVALTADEAEVLWKAAEEAKDKTARDMPATADALRTMQSGFSRLRDLGWREAQYCPKDSTPFAVIQYGSTGIFEAWYMGDWPDGRVYCCDYLTHPHGMLFKPLADLTPDESDLMNECMGREKAAHDREIASLLNQAEEPSS